MNIQIGDKVRIKPDNRLKANRDSGYWTVLDLDEKSALIERNGKRKAILRVETCYLDKVGGEL